MTDVPQKSVKKIFVNQIQVGQDVTTILVVTRLSLREYERGKFLSLRLGDATGKINAVIWDNAEEVSKRIQEGVLVVVQGKVNSYQNELQINLKNIRVYENPADLDPADFLPISSKSQEIMLDEFNQLIAQIQDEEYLQLISLFRSDEALWGKFLYAPGAKTWHHPYLHGLLEHTLNVMKLGLQIVPYYPHVNPDLVLMGAMFHDIGKIEEFDYDFRIDYSTEGRLLGHVYIGAALVDKLILRIPSFTNEKRRQLLHIILSHHGEIERSPILPMTLEACLLHHIENLDAQMAAFDRELDKVRSGSKTWTNYINLIDRFLYLGTKETNGIAEDLEF